MKHSNASQTITLVLSSNAELNDWTTCDNGIKFMEHILSYIILLKIAHIADHTNPDKHGSCSKKYAADIIACEDLEETVHKLKLNTNMLTAHSTQTCINRIQKIPVTLVWISIFRMEPMMVNVSLTMMRMYHPFTNSSLSDHGTSFPVYFLQYSVYSCEGKTLTLYLKEVVHQF